MENININPETPIQSFSSPIQQSPKENNIFKLLFFISIFVLIAVITIGFLIFKKNIKETAVKETNNNQVQTIEEVATTPTVIIEKNVLQNTYTAKSVQDDKNSISKLVLTDQNQKEIIVEEGKYFNMGELTMKPSFGDFIFSPDYKFLFYYAYSGWEASTSILYDIKNNYKIDLNFPATTKGFIPGSKYFYACAEVGMMSGGAIVAELPQMKNIFSVLNEKSFTCQYNKNNSEILFNEVNMSSDEVISQYVFSEKSGSILKMK